MFVRGLRRAAPLLALAALLAACSDTGSKPVALPSLTSTSTPTASPSSTPTASIEAGVIETVRGYYSALNSLSRAMDPTALAAFMTSGCTCQEQVAAVRQAAARHQHYIDHVRLITLTPTADGPTTADVLVQYDAGPAGLVDDAGHVVTHSAAKRGIRRLLHLRLERGRWLIAEIDAA